jgi:hypothetical protein
MAHSNVCEYLDFIQGTCLRYPAGQSPLISAILNSDIVTPVEFPQHLLHCSFKEKVFPIHVAILFDRWNWFVYLLNLIASSERNQWEQQNPDETPSRSENHVSLLNFVDFSGWNVLHYIVACEFQRRNQATTSHASTAIDAVSDQAPRYLCLLIQLFPKKWFEQVVEADYFLGFSPFLLSVHLDDVCTVATIVRHALHCPEVLEKTDLLGRNAFHLCRSSSMLATLLDGLPHGSRFVFDNAGRTPMFSCLEDVDHEKGKQMTQMWLKTNVSDSREQLGPLLLKPTLRNQTAQLLSDHVEAKSLNPKAAITFLMALLDLACCSPSKTSDSSRPNPPPFPSSSVLSRDSNTSSLSTISTGESVGDNVVMDIDKITFSDIASKPPLNVDVAMKLSNNDDSLISCKGMGLRDQTHSQVTAGSECSESQGILPLPVCSSCILALIFFHLTQFLSFSNNFSFCDNRYGKLKQLPSNLWIIFLKNISCLGLKWPQIN